MKGIKSTIKNRLTQKSISSTFYARIFRTKVLFSSYVLAKKAHSYEKCERKMLMKLTAGVNKITEYYNKIDITD